MKIAYLSAVSIGALCLFAACEPGGTKPVPHGETPPVVPPATPHPGTGPGKGNPSPESLQGGGSYNPQKNEKTPK